MPPFPFAVVAFDLDGTLADTAPDLAAGLNDALAALGRPAVAADSVRHLIGHGGRALLRRGLAATGEAPEALVEEGYPIFLEHYGAHICDGTRLYPGIVEALAALEAAGAALALCTNKSEAMASRLLEALGVRNRFAAVVGGDTLERRKPDPAPLIEAIDRAGGGRAVLVGDSVVDADTARAAGVPFVAVSFGYSDRPVEALGADAIIHSYGELIDALEQMASPPPRT
jgi:phosphoglycolate phosphatase